MSSVILLLMPFMLTCIIFISVLGFGCADVVVFVSVVFVCFVVVGFVVFGCLFRFCCFGVLGFFEVV